jgi:hypothetical protein
MLKPNDSALILKTDQITSVKATLPKGKVETIDGIFEDAELRQGHPTVLKGALAEAEAIRPDPPRDPKSVKAFLAFMRLRDEVTKKIRKAKLKVDLRGHWRNGKSLFQAEAFKRSLTEHMFLYAVKVEDLRDLKTALGKKPLKRWIALGSIPLGSGECSHCGRRRLQLETNGMTLRIAGGRCSAEKGFSPNAWELNVPSGKILVANDLRRWFPLPEGDPVDSVNTVDGCRKTAEAYAGIGLSHAYVGNTCPGVYKLADGMFKIASEPADDLKPYPKFNGERVAGVVTDLWWYSLCDVDEFERRAKKFGGSLKEILSWHTKVIDVKPGVYQFKHYDDASRDDSPKETLYATFQWVRSPDPVRDYLAEYESVDVNAHAYVRAMMKQWPALYGHRTDRGDFDGDSAIAWSKLTEEQRLHTWGRIADQIFFTGGSGTDWHEKGFPVAKVDRSVPDVNPPSFRFQTYWYPFGGEYGGIFREKLAPSFAKLAFRCLESIISFGEKVRDDNKGRDVLGARNRMSEAVKQYRRLAKLYPDLADPEYVAWLKEPGRAEKWVENFDLGPEKTEKHHKHIADQRWVPEGTYAVEFDASKMKEDAHFAGPHGWAKKKNATGFAIWRFRSSGEGGWWEHNARDAIPLHSIARVVKLGGIAQTAETLIEVAFDYGTKWMKDPKERKAFSEQTDKSGLRTLTKNEYERLLKKFAKTNGEEPAVAS